MAKLSKARVIFVEGETEFKLFNAFKQQKILHAKKIIRKNFWDEDIRNKSINIDSNSDVVIVFDTDVTNNSTRFMDNVRFLASRKQSVHLLQQTKNFEEELAFCCSINIRLLFSTFCTVKRPTSSDFKRDFNACSNPVQKLLGLGFDQDKWFFRNIDATLISVVKFKSDLNKFFSVKLV